MPSSTPPAPIWRTRAAQRTTIVVAAGHVSAGDAIWSEVKAVFIRLQQFKCLFCECAMPEIDKGSAAGVGVAYDVEHYRPKNAVTPWPTVDGIARRPTLAKYQGTVRSGSPAGYVRLALDHRNYGVSCKVCNSTLKSTAFPIAGEPDGVSIKRVELDTSEQPLLLFPFGDDGDDPGEYLTFIGPSIAIDAVQPHARLRASVVIDLFELDTREDVIRERCMLIRTLWGALEDLNGDDPDLSADGAAIIHAVRHGSWYPQTACGRAYIDLYGSDRLRAREFYRLASQYLNRLDPQLFGPAS